MRSLTPAATSKATPGVSKATPGVRKPHRWKPGTVALREIRQQQNKTDTLVPKAAFERLVREILANQVSDMRLQPAAIRALQNATETYAIDILQKAQTYAVHADRITLSVDDLHLAASQNDVESQQRPV